MADTKLKMDVVQGTVEAEGSEAFVSKVYQEFKALIAANPPTHRPAEPAVVGDRAGEPRAAGRRSRRARHSTSDPGPADKVKNYSPSLDSALDTTGLETFYAPFAPKNHSERILIFARFLDEKKGIRPCTGDQIFTCYRTVREKLPEAFVQALRDASGGRYGYIDYNSPTEITVTVRGTNHLEHGGISLKANSNK